MQSNNAIMRLVRDYIGTDGLKKKQLQERILSHDDAQAQIYSGVFGDDRRACLRVLADLCRQKASRAVIAPLAVRDQDKLLCIDDAKARKTACVLIGLCAPDECAEALCEALARETTRFVIPSIILALGNTQNPEKYLASYEVQPGVEKHVLAEKSALKKALGKRRENQPPAEWKLPVTATITCMQAEAMLSELQEKKIQHRQSRYITGAFDVPSASLNKLRCYAEAMYFIGGKDAYKEAATILDRIGCSGQAYRVEAGHLGADKRRAIIQSVANGFAAYGYEDNPSAYGFEVRISHGKMFAVLPTDKRFQYRKQAISASIHPATAACVMQLCKPYMTEGGSVLDPFCGSALMLIERAMAMKSGRMAGVDISAQALKAATANREASGVRFSLLRKDIRKFDDEAFDEVAANMPFGIRVGDHEGNVKLYTAFFRKLPALLKPDGAAFLYTQEKKLLRECVEKNSSLRMVKEYDFEAGGLRPTLFIIKRRQA